MSKFNAIKAKESILSWLSEYFNASHAIAYNQNYTLSRGGVNNNTKAIIGISGGKDSTIAAALCAEAIGKERVLGVLMPQGEQDDIDVSYDVCEYLGIDYAEINIGDTVQTLYDAIVVDCNKLGLNSTAVFNTPARVRMTALYAVAAIVGGRVVNTCNLSESYVGWETKWGDNTGDFAPLAELTATEVKAVGRELGLPDEFVEKVPADGLCGKTDEEGLGFSYEVLDRYIREGVCECADTLARIKQLHEGSRHKCEPVPRFSTTA
jgi:NAD+ synthase